MIEKIIKKRIKEYLYLFPRLFKLTSQLYKIIFYKKLQNQKMNQYRKAMIQFSHFEYEFEKEIDFLRAHCRNLELELRREKKTGKELFPKYNVKKYCSLRENSKFFRKCYIDKYRWSGLAHDQAMYIEGKCLELLKRSNNGKHHPFPVLLDFCTDDNFILMSDCGTSIDKLRESRNLIVVPEYERQIANMIATMQKAGVFHLDLHADGKNICVSEHGSLFLIDFDIAAISNENILSYQISERYVQASAIPGGYYEWARKEITDIIKSNSDVLVIK